MKKAFVDIKPVKRLSTELLAGDSMLRRVLLSEEDIMPAGEYVAKLGTWLAILKEELSASTRSAQEGAA